MSHRGKKGLSKIPPADEFPRSSRPPTSFRGVSLSPRSRPPSAPSGGWQSATTHREANDLLTGPRGELLMTAMRSALRQELLAFFGDPTALKNLSSIESSIQSRQTKVPGTSPSEAGVSLPQGDDEIEKMDKQVRAQHFETFTKEYEWGSHLQAQKSGHRSFKWIAGSTGIASVGMESHRVRIADFLTNLWRLQEPQRTGLLADIAFSRFFESFIQVIILGNCLEMALHANHEMSIVPDVPDTLEWSPFTVFDFIFQLIYTIELVLKLAVHRGFFFWNKDYGLNTLDMFLVVGGYVELIFEANHGGSTALRTVRILKLGKALRAVKIVAGFRTLRAILVCIQGSFINLLWSVLMLCVVFYIFSLIFVQQAAHRISAIGDISDPEAISLMDFFGGMETSMLTLCKASLGGDDWGVALDVLSGCGQMSTFFYMLFVAFSQIALINIITGIFVDNAMQNLAPSKEQLAMSFHDEEIRCAMLLEKLCSDEDVDQTGCLTQEQFIEGAAGRIPALLELLGLNRDNVKLFFEILCDAAPDKQVDIKSFVRGCMRLKGAATSFDLQNVGADLNRIERNMAREFRGMSERMASVEEHIGSRPR